MPISGCTVVCEYDRNPCNNNGYIACNVVRMFSSRTWILGFRIQLNLIIILNSFTTSYEHGLDPESDWSWTESFLSRIGLDSYSAKVEWLDMQQTKPLQRYRKSCFVDHAYLPVSLRIWSQKRCSGFVQNKVCRI